MKDVLLNGSVNNYIYREGHVNSVLKHAGNLTVVYKGLIEGEGKSVIVKKLAAHVKHKQEYLEEFKRELEFTFEQSNIPGVIEYIEQDENYYIVKEYFQGIDLGKFKQLRPLRKKEMIIFYVKVAIKVLEILEELHKKGYVHCDICPENILIRYDELGSVNIENPDVALIDFGIAKLPGKEYEFAKVHPFTLLYSAPEQVLNIKSLINQSCDIYSLGITLFVLFNPKRFKWLKNQEAIKNLQLTYTFPYDFKIPHELYTLLRRATYKTLLLRPPHRYFEQELEKLLKQGQNKRIKSAEFFKEDLQSFLDKFKNSRSRLKYSKQSENNLN